MYMSAPMFIVRTDILCYAKITMEGLNIFINCMVSPALVGDIAHNVEPQSTVNRFIPRLDRYGILTLSGNINQQTSRDGPT